MIDDNLVETVRIQHVIILDSNEAGDLYMERLYPLWIDPIVFTLEGKYPLNANLRDRVVSALANNKNINCILFGSKSEKYKTASDKKLCMGSFLMQDLTMYFWQSPRFDFNDEKIVDLMYLFCNDRDTDRLSNYSKIFDAYNKSSLKWFHALIS